MEIAEVLGLVVSLLAIIVSVTALIRTREFNSRLLELEEANGRLVELQHKVLEREEQERLDQTNHCEVSAYWFIGSNGSDRIAVQNIGVRDAMNVVMEFEPESGKSSPEIKGEMKETFPIECLRPQEERNILIAPHFQTGVRWPIVLRWENPEGEKLQSQLVLEKM